MVDRSTGELHTKYEVKIPKLYTIEYEQMEKYMVDFLIDHVLYLTAGYAIDPTLTPSRFGWLCKYFWDKINGATNASFYTKECFNRVTDNGKKRFKDTELVKCDWVVFIDKLNTLFNKILPILYDVKISRIDLTYLEYCEFVKNREIINDYKLPVFDLEKPLEQIHCIISEYMNVDYNYNMVIKAVTKRYQEVLNYWDLTVDEFIRFNQPHEVIRVVSQMINLKNIINSWTGKMTKNP